MRTLIYKTRGFEMVNAFEMIQPGFFDLSERYKELSAAGDPLERLNEIIPWNKFRSTLN